MLWRARTSLVRAAPWAPGLRTVVLRRLRLRLHPTSGFRTLLGPPSRPLCSASAPPVAHEKPFWADAVGLAGFGLIGLQWLMSDMLTLRTVAIASSASMILYNMRAVAKPLWIPVCANVAFIAINGVQIARILHERQDISLAPHEHACFEAVFKQQHLSKRQVRELLGRGTLTHHAAGEAIPHGFAADGSLSLGIIVGGRADVVVEGGRTVGTLHRGDFVGEMKFLLGNPKRRHASVLASEPTEMVRWDAKALRAFFDEQPAVHHALEAIWSRQLVRRVRHLDEQERARGAAGLTRRESVLKSVPSANQRGDAAEGGDAAKAAAEGYRMLNHLLGDGPLASLVLWCYRRRHALPAQAVRGMPERTGSAEWRAVR